MMAYHIG